MDFISASSRCYDLPGSTMKHLTRVRKGIILHEVYGFPEQVYFDMDDRIGDEEWEYEISEFTVMED